MTYEQNIFLGHCNKYNEYISSMPLIKQFKGIEIKPLMMDLSSLHILDFSAKIDFEYPKFDNILQGNLYLRNRVSNLLSELNDKFSKIKPINIDEIIDLSQEIIDSGNSYVKESVLISIDKQLKIQLVLIIKGDYHTISEEFPMVSSRLRSFGYLVSRSKDQENVRLGYSSYKETKGFKLSVILN